MCVSWCTAMRVLSPVLFLLYFKYISKCFEGGKCYFMLTLLTYLSSQTRSMICNVHVREKAAVAYKDWFFAIKLTLIENKIHVIFLRIKKSVTFL